MKHTDINKRRTLAKLVAGASLAVPFLGWQSVNAGGHLPKLDEESDQAKALGYKHDTSAVDGAAYPTHDPANKCSGCILYTGKDGAEWGPCNIFPGKEVAAEGWCTAFAPKA